MTGLGLIKALLDAQERGSLAYVAQYLDFTIRYHWPILILMPLLKTVAFLLIAAIANPLCCCLAIAADASETANSETPTAEHACCLANQSSKTDHPPPARHDPSDCPHEVDKASQISQSANAADSLIKSSLFLLTELPPLFAEVLIDSVYSYARSNHAQIVSKPRQPLSQTHCVYLL